MPLLTTSVLLLASSSTTGGSFAGSSPAACLLVGTAVGTTICVAGPRLLGCFIASVLRHLLDNEAFRRDVGQVTMDVVSQADEQIAAVLWSQPMRKGLQDAMVALFRRPDFQESLVAAVGTVSKDRTLKDSIREGVLEALRDEPLRAEVKAVIIEGLQDSEMRGALLRNAILTVKSGIREAMGDAELREVITAAIRDALEDSRLSGVLRSVLKDALADKDLHRATLKGAVQALNPFKHLVIPGRDDHSGTNSPVDEPLSGREFAPAMRTPAVPAFANSMSSPPLPMVSSLGSSPPQPSEASERDGAHSPEPPTPDVSWLRVGGSWVKHVQRNAGFLPPTLDASGRFKWGGPMCANVGAHVEAQELELGRGSRGHSHTIGDCIELDSPAFSPRARRSASASNGIPRCSGLLQTF